MCKDDECQAVLAYKDLDGRLHTTSTSCEESNKIIKEGQKKRKQIEDSFYNVIDINTYDYFRSRELKYAIEILLAPNWVKIRDALNAIKE